MNWIKYYKDLEFLIHGDFNHSTLTPWAGQWVCPVGMISL